MLRLLLFQFLEQFIHRILKFFIILAGFAGIDELQQGGEVLLFLRGFIPDIANQCAVEQASALTQKSSPDFSPSPFVLAIMVLTSFRISFSLRM